MHFAAHQELTDAQLERLGITRAACERRVRFRDARGRFHGGAFAANRFLLHAAPRGLRGAPARLLAVLFYALPPLLLAELLAYEIVARNRNCRLLRPLDRGGMLPSKPPGGEVPGRGET